MSVAAIYSVAVQATETLETNVQAADANQKSIKYTGYNSSLNLNGASTPPVTKCAYFEQPLTSGAATIDLTALPGTNGATVNTTGLKVQVFKIKNKAANANPITVTFGASNAYLLGGSAWKFILQPGMEITVFGNDATPDVGSSTKTIDLAGTGAQIAEVAIIAG